MTAYEVVLAAALVLLAGDLASRVSRERRPVERRPAPRPAVAEKPAHAPAPEPAPAPQPVQPSTLSTLPFSAETRARPMRRVSSAMTLLVLTLLVAGGVATVIYRGLLAALDG